LSIRSTYFIFQDFGIPTLTQLQKANVRFIFIAVFKELIPISWIRFEYKDDSTNPENNTKMKYYDPFINTFSDAGTFHLLIFSNSRNEGININMVLDYAALPGKPPRNSSLNNFVSYFSNWIIRIEQVVSYFAERVDAFEIWNEPDFNQIDPQYDPSVPPDIYSSLVLKPTYNLVKVMNWFSETSLTIIRKRHPKHMLYQEV
jgi:hypothetical protein